MKGNEMPETQTEERQEQQKISIEEFNNTFALGKCPHIALFPKCPKEDCNLWLRQGDFSQCSYLLSNFANVGIHTALVGIHNMLSEMFLQMRVFEETLAQLQPEEEEKEEPKEKGEEGKKKKTEKEKKK